MLRARHLRPLWRLASQRLCGATPAVCALRGQGQGQGQGHGGGALTHTDAHVAWASRRHLSSGPAPADSPPALAEPAAAVPFDQSLDEIAGMRNDTNRLVALTNLISRCKQNEDWVHLLQLGLFLLSSPHYFCHHSCMLVAAALCTSPYSSEALSYMQELAARGIQPHPSAVVKALHALVAEEDHAALANAIISLTEQNVFIYLDIVEFAHNLCMRYQKYDDAERLLQILEADAGQVYVRNAYLTLLKDAPGGPETLGRYEQMRALGVCRPAVFAPHLLACGQTDRAAALLTGAVLLDKRADPRDPVHRGVALRLLLEAPCQAIGHRQTEGKLERFMWSAVRQQPIGAPAFETAMALWGGVGDAARSSAGSEASPVGAGGEGCEEGGEVGGEGVPPPPLDTGTGALHAAACQRRRLEVLFDMVQAGVSPLPSSFRAALGLANPLPNPLPGRKEAPSDEAAMEDVRELNRRGAFKSLAGLWAGVEVACDIQTAPMELLYEVLRDNAEAGLEDTHALLERLGCHPLKKKLMPTEANAEGEVYRYNVEQVQDTVLQHAWVQLLGKFTLAGRIRHAAPQAPEGVAVARHFDMQSQPLLFWGNVKYRTRLRRGQTGVAPAPTTPPTWFLENSKRPVINSFILSESFKSILSYYLASGDNAFFLDIANYVLDHKYYNLQALHVIREQCAERKQLSTFYNIMVELATGMCEDSKNNPYGARLLRDFKSNSHVFSCAGLAEHWAGAMDRRGGHVMLDGLFRDTVSHLTGRLSPKVGVGKNKPWEERAQILDSLATVVLAQTTCGLTCNWKEVSLAIPTVFLPTNLIRNAYRIKMLNFGKLVLFSEHYERSVPLALLLTHFDRLQYYVGAEEIWDSCSPAAMARSEHFAQILLIKHERTKGKTNSENRKTNKFIISIFEKGMLSRGIPFALQLLQRKEGALGLYLQAHMAIVSCRPQKQGAADEAGVEVSAEAAAEQEAAVAQELAAGLELELEQLEKFARVVGRLSQLGATTSLDGLMALTHQFEAGGGGGGGGGSGGGQASAALWSMFLYVEKVVEDLEKLPVHSVPVPLTGPFPEQVAAILHTFNASKRRFSKRPTDKVHTMDTVYPPGHQSVLERQKLRSALSAVVDKLAWAISPTDRELYMRFVTCQSRIASMER
jgi:hypothetical protein